MDLRVLRHHRTGAGRAGTCRRAIAAARDRTCAGGSQFTFTARDNRPHGRAHAVLSVLSLCSPCLRHGRLLPQAGGQLPGLEATENYSAAAEAGRVPPDVSGTVVYENPDTGEQVLMVPAEERTTREANT